MKAHTALVERVLTLPRSMKMLVAGSVDMAVAIVALLAVRYLVHPQGISAINGHLWLVALVAAVSAAMGCWLLGSYRTVTRFADSRLLARTALAALISAVAVAVLLNAYGLLAQTWNMATVYALVAALMLGAWRVVASRLLSGGIANGRGEKVVIYGAGNYGRQLAAALQRGDRFCPIAFIDDRADLHGRIVNGLRTYSISAVDLLKARGVQRVLLAMPQLQRSRRKSILERLETAAVKVMVMPGVEELAAGTKRVDELREVQIEDLLGRDPVMPDAELMRAFTSDQVVMITGGGGSIGGELARQVLLQHARKLVLFEQSEYALYEIERELRDMQRRSGNGISRTEIVPVLGSVLDGDLLRRVITGHKVGTVYHAAAYKHVPLVESNPLAGIRNNLFGTKITVEAAAECGVPHFVLVSTDKAVRPTNVMGATKRVAEVVVQRVARQTPNMRTAIVRFGNVLASSGSVIPLFKKQLAAGGPITVTHKDVTRYFMTIPEAAELVIQAGAMGQHGEIFLLEMGQPVKIVTLAERLIHLSGMSVFNPKTREGDVEIRFTGLRPGEKMIEELLVDGSSRPTSHPRVFVAMDDPGCDHALSSLLEEMNRVCVEGDDKAAVSTVLAFACHRAADDEGGVEANNDAPTQLNMDYPAVAVRGAAA
jgi:FlaA1/EpsC-like NDP-sugar epimerase